MSENKIEKLNQDLTKALSKFKEFYSPDSEEVYKLAATQAFEFTHEIAWKYLREAIKQRNTEYFDSPTSIFKLAGKINILTKEDVEKWIEYTQFRNLTVHMYKQELADEIHNALTEFEKSVLELQNCVGKYLESEQPTV